MDPLFLLARSAFASIFMLCSWLVLSAILGFAVSGATIAATIAGATLGLIETVVRREHYRGAALLGLLVPIASTLGVGAMGDVGVVPFVCLWALGPLVLLTTRRSSVLERWGATVLGAVVPLIALAPRLASDSWERNAFLASAIPLSLLFPPGIAIGERFARACLGAHASPPAAPSVPAPGASAVDRFLWYGPIVVIFSAVVLRSSRPFAEAFEAIGLPYRGTWTGRFVDESLALAVVSEAVLQWHLARRKTWRRLPFAIAVGAFGLSLALGRLSSYRALPETRLCLSALGASVTTTTFLKSIGLKRGARVAAIVSCLLAATVVLFDWQSHGGLPGPHRDVDMTSREKTLALLALLASVIVGATLLAIAPRARRGLTLAREALRDALATDSDAGAPEEVGAHELPIPFVTLVQSVIASALTAAAMVAVWFVFDFAEVDRGIEIRGRTHDWGTFLAVTLAIAIAHGGAFAFAEALVLSSRLRLASALGLLLPATVPFAGVFVQGFLRHHDTIKALEWAVGSGSVGDAVLQAGFFASIAAGLHGPLIFARTRGASPLAQSLAMTAGGALLLAVLAPALVDRSLDLVFLLAGCVAPAIVAFPAGLAYGRRAALGCLRRMGHPVSAPEPTQGATVPSQLLALVRPAIRGLIELARFGRLQHAALTLVTLAILCQVVVRPPGASLVLHDLDETVLTFTATVLALALHGLFQWNLGRDLREACPGKRTLLGVSLAGLGAILAFPGLSDEIGIYGFYADLSLPRVVFAVVFLIAGVTVAGGTRGAFRCFIVACAAAAGGISAGIAFDGSWAPPWLLLAKGDAFADSWHPYWDDGSLATVAIVALAAGVLGAAIARLPRPVALLVVLTPLLGPVFFARHYASVSSRPPYFVKEEKPRTAAAMLRRANECEFGIGCLVRTEEADMSYERAAATGDTAAILHQAIRLERGTQIPRDYARAALLYRKAADAGNRNAMDYLASMLEDGRGVEVDPAEAAALRERAAR